MDGYGIIYTARNIENNKYYIGQTINTLVARKSAHIRLAFYKKQTDYNHKFQRAIRKYGPESFEWNVIYDNIPIELLNEYEVWFVSLFDSFKTGYNSDTGGGNGRVLSKETKKKMSLVRLGEKHFNYGKHLSDEHKDKISKNHARIGGEKHYLYGKHQSEETRGKMSKNHKDSNGDKNSRAKLSWDNVGEIRMLYKSGDLTQDGLAQKFNVTQAAIWRIIHNKTWIIKGAK